MPEMDAILNKTNAFAAALGTWGLAVLTGSGGDAPWWAGVLAVAIALIAMSLRHTGTKLIRATKDDEPTATAGATTAIAVAALALGLGGCAIPGTGDMNTPVTTTAQAAQNVGRTQGQSVSFVFSDQTLTWDIRFPEDVLEAMTDEQRVARDERAATALLLIEKAMDRFALDATATNAERLAALAGMQQFAKGVGAATGSLVYVSLDHASISNRGDSAGLGGEGGSQPTSDPDKPDLFKGVGE